MCETAARVHALCELVGLSSSGSLGGATELPGGLAEYDPDDDPYFWEL